MRRLLTASACAMAIGAAVPAAAAADGGPGGAVQGNAGATAPGGDVAYVAIGVRHRTAIAAVRAGGVERWTDVAGSWGVPLAGADGSTTGLSADGRTLALAELPSAMPVRRTRLLLLDARRLRVRARIGLRGWYAIDAIAPDGRRLYLIHFTRPGRDRLRYEVLAYDVAARRLDRRPVVDPREPDEAMRGTAITRTVGGDGRWAYTLYQRPRGRPFVHALDTVGRTARCIDLPPIGDDLPAARIVPAGGRLLVVREGRALAAVDTRTWEAARPARSRPRAAEPPARGAGVPLAAGVAAIAALLGVMVLILGRRRRAARPA